MLDEFLSLHGNAQPNIPMIKRYQAKRKELFSLVTVQFAQKKNSYLLTISLHFILIIKWYGPFGTVLDGTFVMFSFSTAPITQVKFSFRTEQ